MTSPKPPWYSIPSPEIPLTPEAFPADSAKRLVEVKKLPKEEEIIANLEQFHNLTNKEARKLARKYFKLARAIDRISYERSLWKVLNGLGNVNVLKKILVEVFDGRQSELEEPLLKLIQNLTGWSNDEILKHLHTLEGENMIELQRDQIPYRVIRRWS